MKQIKIKFIYQSHVDAKIRFQRKDTAAGFNLISTQVRESTVSVSVK